MVPPPPVLLLPFSSFVNFSRANTFHNYPTAVEVSVTWAVLSVGTASQEPAVRALA